MNQLLRKKCGGKKVLILGFGREGRSTYNALKRSGADCEISISDLNPVSPPEKDIKVFSGENYQQAAKDHDILFKSPGIVLEDSILDCGCEITCQTNLFLERFGSRTVGITGTKGKSTTTTLLYHVLKNSGVDSVMVGNIGIPCFDKADEIGENTTVVFELSCHQLEFAAVSPHIGVLVNLYEEHLDHYKTAERYYSAKKNICRFQKEGDILFCSTQCLGMLEKLPPKVITVSANGEKADIMRCGDIVSYRGQTFSVPTGEIKLLGEHNLFNIAMVYGIAKEFGVSDDDLKAAVKSYAPPAHRLEFCGNFGGIDYYDDSISTISETCINAVKAVSNVHTLLVGGMDRGIDYTLLKDFFAERTDISVIFMAASGKRIAEEMGVLQKDRGRFHYRETMEQAVELAKEITPPGKACLLSPAAASYGYYKNFEERGDKFKELVGDQ